MKKNNSTNASKLLEDTRLVHEGLHPHENGGFINPPVIHASTVLFPDVETMLLGPKGQRYTYGRRGNPTTDALCEVLTSLENAEGCVLTPSGLAAVSLACLSCLKSGDHILVTDAAYYPTRHFCDTVLSRFGIEITYYDPCIGTEIGQLFKPNTKVIFTESPGSLTFEMQDIDAIVSVAKKIDALVIMDNTWATPLYYKPLDHGVDISLMAGTKYVVGHSDCMLGTIAANSRAWEKLSEIHGLMGYHVGPDDVYLGQRGIRTMSVRLAKHMENALEVANWLQQHDAVAKVYHPALPDSPGHEIWLRDFKGASGLFSFELANAGEQQAIKFLNSLTLFGLGYSWGGFESLATYAQPEKIRTAKPWTSTNPLIRLHIGLEDTQDLKRDLEEGFKAISQN